MAGYVIGSQAWYDVTKQRLLDISKKLRNSETSEKEKKKLYKEQAHLIDALCEYGEGNHDDPE